ncbi:MAG: alpha/beta fold hydrolase [Hyphomicrobiaceae bacterium]
MQTLSEHGWLASPEAARAQWPYRPRFARVNGWRMHYIDEGTGDPVLLLHGNPTWGYLWRQVIPPLVAAGHRVIVPDQIGFGLSEKPTIEHAHTLDGHAANLVALVRQLDLQRLTVVCHDWGGPTGLAMALSNPARIRALGIMSTWAWPVPPAEFHTRVFPWRTMHAPLSVPTCSAITLRWPAVASISPSSTASGSGARRRPSTRPCCPILPTGC